MRLIDADAFKTRLEHEAWSRGHLELLRARDIADETPIVDAVPVRHGKWRFVNCATGLRCQCSECLHWVDAGADKNYCPNCGARMDADETD